ncbi:MAG: hypothetical protein JEY79_17325 [Pseudodesulfovibrio sp.]|nr:hypothetical protein [Pseudodesulfovibrio sp.]
MGVEVIVRDGYSRFSPDNTLLMGDARQMMGREVLDLVCKVIDDNQTKSAYYILVSSRQNPMDERQIKTTILLSSVGPPRMLGTMCFYIDNKAGRAKRLWVLPLDRPSQIIVPGAEFVPEIARQARYMPIRHG